MLQVVELLGSVDLQISNNLKKMVIMSSVFVLFSSLSSLFLILQLDVCWATWSCLWCPVSFPVFSLCFILDHFYCYVFKLTNFSSAVSNLLLISPMVFSISDIGFYYLYNFNLGLLYIFHGSTWHVSAFLYLLGHMGYIGNNCFSVLVYWFYYPWCVGLFQWLIFLLIVDGMSGSFLIRFFVCVNFVNFAFLDARYFLYSYK